MSNVTYLALVASKKFGAKYKSRVDFHRYLRAKTHGTTSPLKGQIMCLFRDQSILFDNGSVVQTLPPGSSPSDFAYGVESLFQ